MSNNIKPWESSSLPVQSAGIKNWFGAIILNDRVKEKKREHLKRMQNHSKIKSR